MPRRAKQTISYEELMEKIGAVLASYPQECRNIYIDRVQVYKERADGANWDVTSYRRSGPDNDLTECREKIAAELRLLRESYDVQA